MDEKIIAHLTKADPVLAAIIPRVELPGLPPSDGVYHDLVSCVLDQQIPARTRGTYMKKLVVLLGGNPPDGNNIYTISEEDWAAAKISNAKYHTLFRVTDYWHEAAMDSWDWPAMSDDEIRQRLTSIKGIGPQTADLILLYTLGRPDVFPVGDYHLKQIMESLYLEEGQKLAPAMLAAAERWAPYRSAGTRYLLAWKEHKLVLVSPKKHL